MASFRTLGVRLSKLEPGFIARVRFPTLMLLDERTPDGRLFESAGAGSRDLPLPISVLTKRSEGGHLGAEVAGRLDYVEAIMDDDGPSRLAGEGMLLDTPEGRKMALLVATQAMKGNSVDLEASRYKSRLVEAEDGDFSIELDFLEWQLMGTTGVPYPAFQEGHAELLDDIDIASLGFSGVETQAEALSYVRNWDAELSGNDPEPTYAEKLVSLSFHANESTVDLADYADPMLEGPTRLTQDDERVFGHVAEWGSCHTSFSECVLAPRSPANYAFAHMDELTTRDGTLAVGRLYSGGDHPGLDLSPYATMQHYDETSQQFAQVRFGEDDHGIWCAGRLMGDFDGRPLSGDWRKQGALELLTALSVDTPGFPVAQALQSNGSQVALTGAGIINGETFTLTACGGDASCGCGCGDTPDEIDEVEVEDDEVLERLPDDVIAWARSAMRREKGEEIRSMLQGIELDTPVNGSVASARVRAALALAGIVVD